MGTDSQMESRRTASGGRRGGGRMEEKGKKDSWAWTTVWSLLRVGSIKGQNGNGKNTIKIKFKN